MEWLWSALPTKATPSGEKEYLSFLMRPESIPELQDLICRHSRVQPHGAKTKTALSFPQEGALQLDLTGLSGLLEYQPEEFTFTALAGTRLAEIEQVLAEHGQYLPFNPPFAARGATLGGTLASGLSGGKVVKNAAGFDLSKLVVGSLGRFGVLVEMSFKVFPRPEATATLRLDFPALAPALEALLSLARAPLELQASELLTEESPGAPHAAASLLVRLGGKPEALPARLQRLQALLGGSELLSDLEEAELWQAAGEFTWLPQGWRLVKVPLTPARLLDFDSRLQPFGALRRYSAGAALAWVGWPAEISELGALLYACHLSGLVVLGPAERVRLGVQPGAAFERRVKQALDPVGKFV
jgi:glycolate oxidase FAD binding subunit